MPTEVDVTYGGPVADGVAGFGVGASGTETDATAYRWTVPADVFSFSVALWPGYVGHAAPYPGVIAPVVLVNVPTEPGDVWLLEPGYPESYGSPIGPVAGATFAGGTGGSGTGIAGYGFAGASATVLSKRTGAGDLIYAVLGGEGGLFTGGTFPPAPQVLAGTPGPTTTGPPVLAPGSGSGGEAGDFLGGGGGGGWPGGAKAPAEKLAGLSGGNYLPASTDLGGERSPTWAESDRPGDGPPVPSEDDFYPSFGRLSVWWFSDDPTGWIIGAVGFG